MGWAEVWAGVLPLVGVAFGSVLGARSQKFALAATQRDSSMRAAATAMADYLSAYRKFRRYVIAEAPSVRLVTRGDDPLRVTEVIEGSRHYWDLVDQATATLNIQCRDQNVLSAAADIRNNFWTVANARADHEIGAVPDAVVKAAKQAEDRFASAAATYLDSFKQP